MKLKNSYFILRHGHSLRNAKKIASCWPEKTLLPLTKKGEKEIKETAKKIKTKKNDLIFYSDLLRTKQTAEIVGKELKIKPMPDKRLREINVGVLNGRPIDEIGRLWDEERKLPAREYYKKRFLVAPPKGETYVDVEKRLLDFVEEMEKKYQSRSILIVSHQRTLTLFEKKINGYDMEKFIKIITAKKEIKTGELRKLS